MDFNALLNTASKNAKNVNKTLESLDSEVAKEKREKLRQIEAEKRARLEQIKKKKAMMPKREPTPEKKFTIPKKKSDEPTVDKSKVQAFLAKKEQAKLEEEKRKKAEKEKLIQLRLQSFGGKANKKMEKHFGMDAMDIQVRFGNDHQHLERLQKQRWREQDEQEQLTDSLRGGVYKAISQKNKVIAKVEAEGGRTKEPHRVSTSKSNSLFGLSSRHASTRDHFSPPRDGKKKEAPKPATSVVQKKRPAPAPVDFNALLKAAEGISQGKKIDISHIEAAPPPKIPRMDHKPKTPVAASSSSASKKPTSSSSSSHASSSKSKPLPSGFTKPSSSKAPIPPPKRPDSSTNSKTSSSTSKQTDAPKPEKKDVKGRFVKGPTSPPLIPAAVPGKRYLPGDVRYKEQQVMLRNGGGVSSSSSSAPQRHSESVKTSSSSRDSEKSKESNKRDHQKSMHKSSAPAMRRPEGNSRVDREKMMEMERRRRAIEKQREARAKQDRYDRMSLVERERERERQRYKEEYGDEEEEEDYDSDMDDFIDDSGMDFDELSRQEFEDTLRMVNPKYNKKQWKERERMINDRDMVADYRTIAKEEARSARLGFMEDLYEAKKNNSEAI